MQNKDAGKVMLPVFWDAQSAVLVDFLEKVVTVTSAYYVNLIPKPRDVVKEKRRGSCTRCSPASKYHPQAHVPHCKGCNSCSRL